MKVYFAGKYFDENIPSHIEKLKKEGFIITHDWTKHKGDRPELASLNDLRGVHDCDYLIAIMDDLDYPYRGTFTEIGYGLGLNKNIIIINPNENSYCKSNCFYHHPKIMHFNSLDEVIYLLNKILQSSIEIALSNIDKNIFKNLTKVEYGSELKYITEGKVNEIMYKSLDKVKNKMDLIKENKTKYLIIGSARFGKDTFADMVYKLKGKKSISSSQIANELFIFNELKEKYNYNNLEECFNDRVNHRKEWYDLICNYNKDDKTRLTKEIFKNYDIYIGLRDRNEFLESRHLFDLVIMIDASDRINYIDNTFLLNNNDADIIITNNGSIEEFNFKCTKIIEMIF